MAGGNELQHQQSKGLKLFGVRIVGDEADPTTDDVMRKSASTGNLVSASAADNAGAGGGENGYLSDGGLHPSSRRRRDARKRGVPWTEEEHRTFLAGLQKLGKGDWRGISRNFVTTRTPTQVASHAQKYFLRQSNINKKKRRSSLFDVVIDSKIPAAETEQKPPTEKITETAEAFDWHSHDNHMVSDSSVTKDQAVPANVLDETLGIADHAVTCFNTNPLFCTPNVPNLSLQYSHFQTKSAVSSSNVDSSNLELRIAPPQASTLPKLSLHSLAGVIRVI